MDTVTKIIELIQKRGLNGVQYGTILGLKKSPITDWKNNKSQPTLAQIQKTATYFNVSVDYLLGRNEDSIQLAENKGFSDDALEMLKAYDSANDDVKNGIRRFLGLSELSVKKEKRA